MVQTFLVAIQWGSEIRTSPDFEWSKRGWVANGPDFEWDFKYRSPTIWNPDKWPPFPQKPFEIWKKVLDFKWSGFQMVGTIARAKAQAWPFENRTIWNPTFKKSGFHMFPDFKWSDYRSPLYLYLTFLNILHHNTGYTWMRLRNTQNKEIQQRWTPTCQGTGTWMIEAAHRGLLRICKL